MNVNLLVLPVGNRLGPAALAAVFLAAVVSSNAFARTATLDDARALRSIDALSVDPVSGRLAVQTGNTIEIVLQKPGAPSIASFTGIHPQWSPDGRWLAFYGVDLSKPQVVAWDSRTGRQRVLTDFEEGISPDGGIFMGDPWGLAWSPDSRRIAFATRRMQGFENIGQHPGNIRVFDGNSARFLSLEDLYGGAPVWSGYEEGNPSYAINRMRAVEATPQFRVNHLFVVDIEDGKVRQLTHDGSYYYPQWLPDGARIAAIAIVNEDAGYTQGLRVALNDKAAAQLRWIDAATGTQRRVENAPTRLLGAPKPAPGGRKVLMLGKQLSTGFQQVLTYDEDGDRWETVELPHGMSAREAWWSQPQGRWLVQAFDRIQNTLWEIDPISRRVIQRDCGPVHMDGHNAAQDRAGNLYFSASGPKFLSRLIKCSHHGRAGEHTVLLDPNPQLSELDLGEQRMVRWKNSAGESLDGLVVLPPDYRTGHRYPVIVNPYPLWPRNRLVLDYPAETPGQIHATWGYVIFIPAPRSPHAYVFTRDAAFTEKARGAAGIPLLVDDVESGLGHLADLGLADADKVAVFGHSNGAYNANLLITHSKIARCAVVFHGYSNMLLKPTSYSGNRDDYTGTTLYEKPQDYLALSPIARMDEVTIPLLMLMGDRDFEWAPHMMAQFHALAALGRGENVILVRYTDEGHSLLKKNNTEDALRRLRAFYGRCFGEK